MPLTESGRAFWSFDETEALLAAAPRWGFSAAKLRENVAALSHFSTKQVSSKLADLQIQNRSGGRPSAAKKKSQNGPPSRHDRKDEARAQLHGEAATSGIGMDTHQESAYDSRHSGSSGSTSPVLDQSKKRERNFVSDLPMPDAKRGLTTDPMLLARLSYAYPNPAQLANLAAHSAHLPSPFSSGFGFSPSLMYPQLLGLSNSPTLFPTPDTASSLESGVVKQAILLKDGFQVPPSTKPSILEAPHPAIRCYASAEVYKIVLHPVVLGTTVDILLPSEPFAPSKAVLKIDWKLAATPFDAEFDFRRHSSLCELYHCPLPSNINTSGSFLLHQSTDAICLMLPLRKQGPQAPEVTETTEAAIFALSNLASAATEDEPTSSTVTASASPSNTPNQTPNDEAANVGASI